MSYSNCTRGRVAPLRHVRVYHDWKIRADALYHSTIEQNLGVGAADALPRLANLGQTFAGDLFGNFAPRYPLLLNVAMIMAQLEREKRYHVPPTSGKPFTNKSVLAKAARYAKFANAAYCTSKEDIVEHIPHFDDKDGDGH